MLRRAPRVPALFLAALSIVLACGCQLTTGPRSLPAGPVYGVTVDSVSNISDIVAAAKAFGHFPTTRVVFDLEQPADHYVPPLVQLFPHSYVMGELLDSSDMAKTDPASEHARVASYLAALRSSVDIWEVGNEINGNWTCNGQTVCTPDGYRTGAQMVTDAFNQAHAAGLPTALNLFYNNGCGDDPEPDPLSYSQQYLPQSVRDGLKYVLVSYYETQCNNIRLSTAIVTSFMQNLHNLYPNAKVGFGEVGLPNPVTAATMSQAESIIGYYYGLPINLPYYIGGYWYWHYGEDAIPYKSSTGATNPIWNTINAAFGTKR